MPLQSGPPRRSLVRLGFLEADNALPLFELSAFLEHLDTLEALQNVALRLDRSLTTETSVLTHKARDNSAPSPGCNPNPFRPDQHAPVMVLPVAC